MKGCPHLIYPAPGASGAWDFRLGLKAYGLQLRLFWVDCHMLGMQVLYSSELPCLGLNEGGLRLWAPNLTFRA